VAIFTQTAKWSLRKLTGSNAISDIDAGFDALAEDLDPKLTPSDHGLLANRPISTAAQPGKFGRTYHADDHGVVFFDTGTSWIALNEYIGHVSWWAGAGAPAGGTHLEANGQAISRSAYPLYMSLIGTQHGAGDGTSTVNLPDARGRVLIGPDGAGIRIPNSPRAHAQAGGTERHTLTIAEIPPHAHSYTAPTGETGGGGGVSAGPDASLAATTGPAGGGAAHNSMQPYLVLTPIVRVR
jgi:microcystin-dependent protein